MEPQFDYYEIADPGFRNPPHNETYFLNEICETIGLDNPAAIDKALQRSFDTCLILEIPVKEHFLNHYQADQENIFSVWTVTKKGLYIFLLSQEVESDYLKKARERFL